MDTFKPITAQFTAKDYAESPGSGLPQPLIMKDPTGELTSVQEIDEPCFTRH
jgi:hypothetical protein